MESHVLPEPNRQLVGLWIATMLILFAVLAVLGVVMRSAQGTLVGLDPSRFYSLMTLHGLGMAGVTYSAGFAALVALCSRYARPSLVVYKTSFVLVVLGALGLVGATLIGRFGPGWYVLYPLPFLRATWPSWSTGLAIISLILLGVGWLIGQLDLLHALARQYGLRKMMGWHWYSGSTEQVPVVVLIGSVVGIAGALSTIVGAAMLMMYLLQWLNPSMSFDALLMKNMVFFFGHTIVNIAMYCGVAVVYELLPDYTGRPWKGNSVVAASWNATLLIVLFAYFHHLYADFQQPTVFHVFGQFASYAAAIPATAVTALGVVSQIWRAGVKWSYAPLAMVAGVVGWVNGGFAAVVDATIVVNRTFHNTLWVPGHFHTYFVVGFMLLLMAFAHRHFGSKSDSTARLSLWAYIVAGYGLVAMFYLGGMAGVPRRYAGYAAIQPGTVAKTGTILAKMGAAFGLLLLLALIAFGVTLAFGRREKAVAG